LVVACTEQALRSAFASQPPLYSDELSVLRQATYEVLIKLAREESAKADRRLLSAFFFQR
jgi:hypothetical protein